MKLPVPVRPVLLSVVLLAVSSADASMQGRGQPCGFGGRCDSGLVCAFAVCVPPAGAEGGVCRMSGSACDSGLECTVGVCAPRGGSGQVCRSDGSCDSGLACVALVCVPTGGMGQPCRAGGGCDAGLECVVTVCAPAVPRGGAGQPCRSGGTCDAGLRCVAAACINAGGLAQPCLPDGGCNAGLACLVGACAPAGALAQPCLPDGSCNAGLACLAGACAPAGGLLQPCRPGGGCDGGLLCQAGLCTPPIPLGGLGQACRPDGTCDAGLQCRFGLCVLDQLTILELPYERALRDYLSRRTFGGRFDDEGYRAAAAHVARMPAARLPALDSISAVAPGTVRSALTGETGATWEYVGPTNLDVPYQQYYGVRPVAGRINAVAYRPDNPKVIFAGSAGGGLFRSDDGGATWKPLSDRADAGAGKVQPGWPDLHVSAIAISNREPRVIYVGLGDFPGRLPLAGGIMKSTDGGSSWANLGAAQFGRFAVSQILIDPDDPRILIATTGRGSGGEGQVWRSADAGLTWNAVFTTPAQWSGAAIGARPGTGGRAYYVVGTLPATASSPRLAVIRRSVDRGVTWAPLTAPTSGSEDVFAVAASPQDANTVYALLPLGRTIWRSKDRGATWTSISGGFPNGSNNYNWSQSWYDYFIASRRRNGRDVLYVGLIDVVMSPDGGETWSSVGGPTYESGAKTHNDQHAIAFHPTDPNEFLLANDGGVYRGRFDPAKGSTSFESLNRSLPVTMFYRAAFHPSDPNVMLGGTQDNATAVSTGDLRNWLNKGGGDGGGSGISPQRPNIQYTSAQGFPSPLPTLPLAGLWFYRTDSGWQLQGGPLDGWQTPQQLIPPFTGSDRQPFISDLTIDPGNSTVIYTGTQFLWRLDDTFPLGPWRWSRVSTTALSTGSTITRIAVAPSDRNTIYTASGDGEVWATFDGGATWARLNAASVGPCTPTPTGGVSCPPANSLSVNPGDPRDVLVGFSSTPGAVGTLFRCVTTSSGSVWTGVSGAGATALPNVALNAIARDPDRPGTTFYAGTDLGVFMSDDAGTRWFDAGSPLGLPSVQVNDLVVVPTTRFLNAATFGRGMWRLALAPDQPEIDTFTMSPDVTSAGGWFSARVTLTRTAPPTGVDVMLASSNPAAVAVPATVTVPATQSELTFSVRSVPALVNAGATITATLRGASKTAGVKVRRTEAGRLRLEPAEVTGSDPTSGTVFLSGLAPAAGATVALSSACPAVRVPPTVSVVGGQESGAFTVQTDSVAQTQTCAIRAELGTATTAELTLRSPTLSLFGLDAMAVVGGRSVTGFVELDRPAPPGGMPVHLESSNTAVVIVPAVVMVAAGELRAPFTATSRSVTRKQQVILSAWVGTRTTLTQVLTRTLIVAP